MASVRARRPGRAAARARVRLTELTVEQRERAARLGQLPELVSLDERALGRLPGATLLRGSPPAGVLRQGDRYDARFFADRLTMFG